MPSHYADLLDPTMYPDYRRRPIRVPTWSTFGNTTQLITLRGFEIRDNRLVDYEKTLDTYVEQHKLGRIIWPNFSNVYAENFNDLVMELKKRGLFLFDIWGHVPGSEPIGWGHLLPLPGQVKYLERTLGRKFLGFDNGEQDGRYVGGYASTQCPAIQDRFRQYLKFQRHFERLGDDMGNHMSALVSLCYGHYFIKENNHVLLGAETAQALPNSQIYYAFIRGACKQYGILWFGNASVFNRWSWKDYAGEGGEGTEEHGPTKGTSTNLLKRLMYTHYLYNCMAVGFESGWFMKDGSLSPIGHIQAAVGRFIEEHGQPGTMHTPVALLLDPFAGWCVPRHLYTDLVYQVWGAMPYDAGDYLTHGVLSALYPGYEDASYFHDERGFLSPTPHGDMADCLLSDVPAWVLSRYGVVVAAGRLRADPELKDKLNGFVSGGGHLVLTAENARTLWPEWQIGPAGHVCPAVRRERRSCGRMPGQDEAARGKRSRYLPAPKCGKPRFPGAGAGAFPGLQGGPVSARGAAEARVVPGAPAQRGRRHGLRRFPAAGSRRQGFIDRRDARVHRCGQRRSRREDETAAALCLEHQPQRRAISEEIIAAAGKRLGLALLSAPARDLLGQSYDAHRPLAESGLDVSALSAADVPVVLDGDYSDWAAVYADLRRLSASAD